MPTKPSEAAASAVRARWTRYLARSAEMGSWSRSTTTAHNRGPFAEGTITSGMLRCVVLAVSIVVGSGLAAAANDRDDRPDPVALWAAIQDASATLEAGITASEQQGQPIAARFDIQDGDLELLITTKAGDGFTQVVLHTNTAAVLWTEPILASEDLTDATAQNIVMARAKLSLLSAVQRALRDNTGSRAVSVAPELQDGHPIAVVTLLHDKRFMTVSEWLE